MYEYIYNEGKSGEPIFILLHGTGADERNLLPVAEVLNTEATVLSIRGNVSENGMNRYFKRHAEGQYDVEDLMKRGQELKQFIEEKAEELLTFMGLNKEMKVTELSKGMHEKLNLSLNDWYILIILNISFC